MIISINAKGNCVFNSVDIYCYCYCYFYLVESFHPIQELRLSFHL